MMCGRCQFHHRFTEVKKHCTTEETLTDVSPSSPLTITDKEPAADSMTSTDSGLLSGVLPSQAIYHAMMRAILKGVLMSFVGVVAL